MLRMESDSEIIIKDKEAFDYMCSFVYEGIYQGRNGETEIINLFDINKFMNDNGFICDDINYEVIINKEKKSIYFNTIEYVCTDTSTIPFVLSRKYPRVTIEYIYSSCEEDNEFSDDIKSIIKRECIISQTIIHWENNCEDNGYTTITKTNNPSDMCKIDDGYIRLLKKNNLERNQNDN